MNIKLFFAFSILFFLGCSVGEFLKGPGLPGPSRKSPVESADMYYKLLMWKSFDRAAALVDQEKRSRFEAFVHRNKDNLNITDYQIKEVILGEDGQASTVKVVVTYYKYPSVSEKTSIVEDAWILNGQNWFISPDFEHEIYR